MKAIVGVGGSNTGRVDAFHQFWIEVLRLGPRVLINVDQYEGRLRIFSPARKGKTNLRSRG